MLIHRTLKTLIATALTLNLIACGGGSGGSKESTASTSSSTTAPGSQTTSTLPASGSPVTTPPKRSVTLSWVAPSSRQNGEPLTSSELAGYEIYYFEEGSPESDDQVLVINDAATTEATIDKLTPGTYFFAIATIDTDGLESDISDYVEAEIE